MCGIVSVFSLNNDGILKRLVDAMEKLEYRGYDSAGIAYINQSAKLNRVRSVGKISKLREAIAAEIDELSHNITDWKDQPDSSSVWIGHTRWATHGQATERNAHPHICDGIAIAHNGIIENYRDLKNELLAGYEFESETDSEVIAKVIAHYVNEYGLRFEDACRKCMNALRGTFAIVAICQKTPDTLVGMKAGSPMAIGIDDDRKNFYVASDAMAMASLSRNIAYLEEGDFVVATKSQSGIVYKVIRSDGTEVERQMRSNKVRAEHIGKSGYESFMLKEIFEEASVIRRTYDTFNSDTVDISKFSKASLVACGTSYYACLLAKYWIEDIAKIPTDVEIASEFRYRNPALIQSALYVFVSQSGETIDTLCAMRLVKGANCAALAIVNVESSSIAREADIAIITPAGPEIGVASTKSFMAQIMTFLLMCVRKESVNISQIETAINSALSNRHDIEAIAKFVASSRSVFYIGRGSSYPIALEGALKMKEISYINAEGYPAGEIKHGPIALVDEEVCSVVIAPSDRYFDKTISNMQEIIARRGRILLLASQESKEHIQEIMDSTGMHQSMSLFLPTLHEMYNPFIYGVAVHLIAYYTAKLLDRDVDKPRNLAKSVTVE
ncbi:MAG: glutamine--fructose-6-phosphate transaminase (isomerizing) [Holosporales bacterium]|jgi:glucosamine--fructose-6-phosphate aminotransferase (isomerizing)|nr:glutamine--fructose-6-phosphate transaminase (isomerizing) [Holosporales bacterium]